MITKFFASLAIAVLLACVCLAAAKPVTDDGISDQVRIKLASDPIVKGGALTVDCKQGVVTITGDVATQKQKDKATVLAKKIKGVKQVVNNITIQQKVR